MSCQLFRTGERMDVPFFALFFFLSFVAGYAE
jgi:hypothetical protein